MRLFEHPDFEQAIIRAADYSRPPALREAIMVTFERSVTMPGAQAYAVELTESSGKIVDASIRSMLVAGPFRASAPDGVLEGETSSKQPGPGDQDSPVSRKTSVLKAEETKKSISVWS